MYQYIQAFPENVPPSIYGAFFGLLLNDKFAEDSSRQTVKIITAFIEETLAETGIGKNQSALQEFSNPTRLKTTKPDWMNGKDYQRILRASYAYAELKQ